MNPQKGPNYNLLLVSNGGQNELPPSLPGSALVIFPVMSPQFGEFPPPSSPTSKHLPRALSGIIPLPGNTLTARGGGGADIECG